jgi:hypothetical protein
MTRSYDLLCGGTQPLHKRAGYLAPGGPGTDYSVPVRTRGRGCIFCSHHHPFAAWVADCFSSSPGPLPRERVITCYVCLHFGGPYTVTYIFANFVSTIQHIWIYSALARPCRAGYVLRRRPPPSERRRDFVPPGPRIPRGPVAATCSSLLIQPITMSAANAVLDPYM